MTRQQIRAKYGIQQLEHPSVANVELSVKEAEAYEKFLQATRDAFDHWDDEEYWKDVADDADEPVNEKTLTMFKNLAPEEDIPF